MTATYGLDPANDPTDAIRLMIGDTDVANAQLQDEEIDYFVSLYQTGASPTQDQLIRAAMDAIRAIIAKIDTSLEEEQAGKVRVRLFDRRKGLLDLIANLEKQVAALSVPTVFAGGIDKARIEQNNSDTTRQPPVFSKHMHDHPDSDVRDSINPDLLDD